MKNIIQKSEKAKFITRRFEGVRRPFVVENIWITRKLPVTEMLWNGVIQFNNSGKCGLLTKPEL